MTRLKTRIVDVIGMVGADLGQQTQSDGCSEMAD